MYLFPKSFVARLACLLTIWASGPLHAFAQTTDIQVPFYGASLTLPACPGMPLRMPENPDASFFQTAYNHFDACEYHPFLKKIGDYRRGMSLSDWHFYEIICRSSTLLFPKENENFRVLFQWFILRKSGIDARLSLTGNALLLHAPSDDIEFGFYSLEQAGRRFVNLSARRNSLKLDSVTAILTDAPYDGATMGMDMRIRQIPHLVPSKTVERLIEFTHKGKPYSVRVMLNKNFLKILDEYPYYNQAHYFETGLSPEAENSLFPALNAHMTGMSTREQVEFLMSFTRTSFFYQDDMKCYGTEKPMTPEQTLFHTYSDCEDRSALFFYLCRKLLNLPAVVLDFETHVGVAVALKDEQGVGFDHAGMRFVYCEATGPQDDLKIGEMWPQVQVQRARVISEYLPQ